MKTSYFYFYFFLSDISIDVSTFIADLFPNSASRLFVPSLPFSTYLYFNLYLSFFDLNSLHLFCLIENDLIVAISY